MSERRDEHPSELNDDSTVLLYLATGGDLTAAEQSDPAMLAAAELRGKILAQAAGGLLTPFEVQGPDTAVA